jgi:hypothetical protein
MKFLNLSFMLPVLLLAGCAGKTKTLEHEISLPFTCSGPIFEGSNTAAPEFKNFMDSLLKANGLKAEQVQSVKLVSATMSTEDSSGFDATGTATVSMSTPKAKMQEVAVLNPIAKGSKSITLKTSDERELREYFSEQNISMVCDLNFGADRDADFHLKGNFRFRITVKE